MRVFNVSVTTTHLATLQDLVAEFLVSFGPHVLHFVFTSKNPELFVGTVVEHDGFSKNTSSKKLRKATLRCGSQTCASIHFVADYNLPFF